MFRNGRPAAIKLAAALMTVAATGVLASPASAISTGETVAGTTLSSLSLTAGTGALLDPTHFAPGNTATGLGALTAIDTSPTWSLQVKDTAASNAGKLAAGTLGCTGSEANISSPLQVSVSSPLGGVTTAGTVSMSGTNQTVASATNQLLAADLFTTNYSQSIPSSDQMLNGCVYSLTATYTLQ
jgi:hypothetical protein